MENLKKGKIPNINLRYNTLTVLIYIIGAILLVSLFNIQIVKGAEYRKTSNTRLTRESVLYATRGDIVDRNGTPLATSKMTFTLEMYKTKIESNVLNDTILRIVNTLNENGDKYTDTFPIKINPFSFDFSSEEKKKTWLKKYSLDEDTSAEDAFYYFKDRYEIENDNIEDIRKILTVRYRISSEGYSATKSLTITKNISRKSALIFEEQGDKYPGIDVVTDSQRFYPNERLASHILRKY